MNKIRVRELLGGLPKAVERLLVQAWVVREPEHDGARIWIEVEVVISPKQRLNCRRGHDRLSRAGGCRQRKRRNLALVGVPEVVSRPLKVGKDVIDGLLLVVLQGKLQSDPRP